MVLSAVGSCLASLPTPTQTVLKGISDDHVAFKIIVEANEHNVPSFRAEAIKLKSVLAELDDEECQHQKAESET